MAKLSKKSVKEAKAVVRLYLFLRDECGLREADRLSVRGLKRLLLALKSGKM